MTLAGNIGEIRARAEAWLTDSCTITPMTYLEGEAGNETLTAGTAFTAQCLFMPAKRITQGLAGGGITTVAEVPVFFAVGTEITPIDRITHGERVYEVISIEDTSLTALLKVITKEII
jgi:hypothetical protein